MSTRDDLSFYVFPIIAAVSFLLSYLWVRNYDDKLSYRWLNAVGALGFIVWRSQALDASPEEWSINGSRLFAALMMAAWVGGNELGALMGSDTR
jgi:nitrate reductase NapE component